MRGPPELLQLHRDEHPEAVARGIPLHVTVLFPFVPVAGFGAEERERLRGALVPHPPFEFELTRLERWPAVLWLAPEPPGPLRALTDAVWTEFPDRPPYEGAFDEPIPHATLAEGAATDADAERLQRRLASLLPVGCRADHVTLLAEDAPEVWRERDQLPLRVGP